MWHYYNGYDPGQRQLQTTNRGLILVAKYLFKALVYSPLIITAYVLCTLMLAKKAHGLLWFGLTLMFAYVLYMLVMALKNVLNRLKSKGNYWWVALFFFCTAFTCVLPAYIIYAPLNHVVIQMKGTPAIARIIVFCFAVYVYFQYDFLQHKPPHK